MNPNRPVSPQAGPHPPPGTTTGCPRRAAFTLIELLVVLAIVAILAA